MYTSDAFFSEKRKNYVSKISSKSIWKVVSYQNLFEIICIYIFVSLYIWNHLQEFFIQLKHQIELLLHKRQLYLKMFFGSLVYLAVV